MTRGYVWFGVLGVCGCCATIANALIVYDNSGVHEVSTPVFDDIHVLDGLYAENEMEAECHNKIFAPSEG